MSQPWRPAEAPTAARAQSHARRGRVYGLAERVPDLLPVLALIAAGLARLIPWGALAARVDLLLAALVFVTALDIDPRQLLRVASELPAILLLAVAPLIALTSGGWALAQLVHGEIHDGVLALGVAPTEVASVGLIGLMGGAAELAIAVLAVSLVVSALAGPPILSLLGDTGHGADIWPLLGRFALVVIVPLAVGLLARGTRPQLARREVELSVSSSLIVVILIFASLSGTHGGNLGTATLISAAFLAYSGLIAAGSLRALRRRTDPTLAFTIAMRDFAVAAALAAGAFGPGAAEVAGVYGTLMLIAGASATAVVRRKASSGPGTPETDRRR